MQDEPFDPAHVPEGWHKPQRAPRRAAEPGWTHMQLVGGICTLAALVLGIGGGVVSDVGTGIGLFFVPFLVQLYFLPTIIAADDGHRNVPALGVLNLLLGWTLIGWALAMVWALYRERR